MMIKRIIPNVSVACAGAGREFCTEFLGLEKDFSLGWIARFRSPADDVDAAYALAQATGLR